MLPKAMRADCGEYSTNPHLMHTRHPQPATRRPLRLRYSMRTFLVVVTLGCCWLGYHIHSARRQQGAVEAIRQSGGKVYYAYQVTSGGSPGQGAQSWAPRLLREPLGNDFFHRAVTAEWTVRTNPEVEAALRRVTEIGTLRFLRVFGPVSDAHLVQFSQLKRLEELRVWNAREVTDAGVAPLASLSRLKKLQLDHTQITDKSLEHISHMPQIEVLFLNNNQLTDAGVAHLRRLTRLRELRIDSDPQRPNSVTDKSLEFLLELPDLEKLGVKHTGVSKEFLEKIKQRFPNCWITK